MALQNYEDGGFVADGEPLPQSPQNWYVWHFTLSDWIPEIVASSCLLCDDSVSLRSGSVADPGIKQMRRQRLVSAGGYPVGRTVSEHVPWYIAAKSPMLFRVKQNYPSAKLDSLVFFGMKLGDLFDAGLDWVASNGNAASALAEFSANASTLGSFVDFELLTAKWWNNTPQDPHRMHRRAAEILVHSHVPLGLVSVVVARTESTQIAVKRAMDAAGFTGIQYVLTNTFFE
jgi:hypothetical protein